jgi:hypothetical protein
MTPGYCKAQLSLRTPPTGSFDANSRESGVSHTFPSNEPAASGRDVKVPNADEIIGTESRCHGCSGRTPSLGPLALQLHELHLSPFSVGRELNEVRPR